ncbi:MAG: hypothetical protein KAJ15_11115 [Spirochaetes bacterium]|nr:hypothetical protein [Spirochaetota bacterium]
MIFLKSSFFKKYLLPGFVFQSVIIAGGYGTGRELVEYFLKFGPLGGLLGMLLITTVMWSIVLAVTFEFSRIFHAYDYRSFFRKLIGPFWFIYEIIYILFLFIVLAVLGSASGIILRDNFGLPYIVGVMIMLAAVGFMTFKGSGLIENFLSIWSMVLYLIYGIFFVVALIKFGPEIQKNLSSGIILPNWALGAFKYAFYNLACVAAVLFCLNHIKTRKEAITAGLLSGVIAIFPGFLFFIVVVGQYPTILPEEIPAIFVLQKVGIPALLILFQIVLFGTLIETGTGMIHSVNERIQAALRSRGKELHRWQRPLVAVSFLLIALGTSTFGLISLIAKGYGTASWGFLFVYIVPVMTYGIYKIFKVRNSVTDKVEKK